MACPEDYRASFSMESTARDRLRRDVRRVVHRTCLRHFEHDQSSVPTRTEYDLEASRAACTDATITDDEVSRWIEEEEAEFQRALLISELVARRVGSRSTTAPTKAAAVLETPAAAATRPARSEPSITALLDDMFAQRAPASRR